MTLAALQWLAALALFVIPAILIYSFVTPMLRKARHLRAQAEYKARLGVLGARINTNFSKKDSGGGGV
jgi:peptidoglycan/LPS O-acetylase OafA/YrhL